MSKGAIARCVGKLFAGSRLINWELAKSGIWLEGISKLAMIGLGQA